MGGSSMSSEFILLIRVDVEEQGVGTWYAYAEREGTLKIKAYWKFREKEG